MLVNDNGARKSRVGYSRLPTEFHILETQLQATMIIVGISKCTQHVCESGIGIPAIFDDGQLLAGYHWHFHAYPMILCIDATDYLNFKNKHTHTHTRTRTRTGGNLQYNISTEWNILKCAHDFLKCMLCLAYPTIILDIISNHN